MNILLVNYGTGVGPSVPVQGRSGKEYGRAIFRRELKGHVFSLTLEEYKKIVVDVLENKRPLQQWIPFPEEQPVGDDGLNAILELLKPVALEEDNTPLDTLKRILSPKEPAENQLVKLGALDIKALKELAKEKGIETKGMRKCDIVEALVAFA